MSKLVFPAVSAAGKASRGYVSQIRDVMRDANNYIRRNPKSIPDVVAALNVLLAKTLTSIGITNGAAVNVKNSAGTKTVAGTANVSAGVLNSIDLPATAALVTSAQALTGVTPTGTFATTVTFTVTAGVISAIVLS